MRHGLTLVELIVVLVVIATLAALTIPLMNGTVEQSADTTTRTTLIEVRNAIMDHYWPDMGDYPRLNASGEPRLHFLFVKPPGAPDYSLATRRGWNGPYLKHNGSRNPSGDVIVNDAWMHAIVLQEPNFSSDPAANARHARLISAGPDGIIQTPASLAFPSLSQCGDDIVVYLRVADQRTP